MTISAVTPIYDFRHVSRVTGERNTTRPARSPEPAKRHQLDLFDAQVMQSQQHDTQLPEGIAVLDEQLPSISELFDQFFQNKIGRFDADEDGRLDTEEFYGSQEQFAGLDLDEDGYINAEDLKRQFMEANPGIHEMTEGYARGLYSRIMNTGDSDRDELTRMVETFFADLLEKNDENHDGYLAPLEFPGTVNEFKSIAGSLKHGLDQADMTESFLDDNPDLVELRESLLGLKEMIKPREVRPHHVDAYL